MRPFRFKLKALQTLRQRQEHVALEHYAAALRDRQSARDALGQARDALERCWLEWHHTLEAGCTIEVARRSHASARLLSEHCSSARAVLTDAEQRVQTTLHAMLEARRQREIVDTLHDQHRTRHTRACLQAEAKELDEFALRRQPAALAWKATPPATP
jgi:flagellar export protein FliJ